MKKYIDAEKLIKSVNNYHEGAKAAFNPIDGDADYYKGKIDACENIQELIAYIQQEQPDVDLEREITKWLDSGDITDTRSDDYRDSDIESTARHFYELGLNARKEE